MWFSNIKYKLGQHIIKRSFNYYLLWYFDNLTLPHFSSLPKSTILASHCTYNRIQTPSLGYQTLHGMSAAYLLSFHTLTIIHSVPNTLALRIYYAFPTRKVVCMLSGKHPDPSLTSIPLTDCFLTFRSQTPCLSCYLLFCQTCQSTWRIVGHQKIFVEGRKERKQKGKREENNSCLLHCERLQMNKPR